MSSKNQNISLLNLMITGSVHPFYIALCLLLFLTITTNESCISSRSQAFCMNNQLTLSGILHDNASSTGEYPIIKSRNELALLLEHARSRLSEPGTLGCYTGEIRSDKHGNIWCTIHGAHRKQKWAGEDPIPKVVLNPPLPLRHVGDGLFNLQLHLPKSILALATKINANALTLLGLLSFLVAASVLGLYFCLSFLWSGSSQIITS